MGLFFKKKKKEEEKGAEKLPPLPSIPKFEPKSMNFELPTYDRTLSNIKNEVEVSPKLNLAIPVRKPSEMIKKRPIVAETAKTEVSTIRERVKEGKPIFVKIDKYKEALDTIDSIKLKIQDAERIISNIENVMDSEQKNIESWKADLKEIKEKLMQVDNMLYEPENE